MIQEGYYTFYDLFGDNYGSLRVVFNERSEGEGDWWWASWRKGFATPDSEMYGPFPTALHALRDASPNHPLVEEAEGAEFPGIQVEFIPAPPVVESING